VVAAIGMNCFVLGRDFASLVGLCRKQMSANDKNSIDSAGGWSPAVMISSDRYLISFVGNLSVFG
jgi:hypothetical protein